MKKTIIQSSALAIICLLAVSYKSFAQTEKPEKCKEVETVHIDKIDVGIASHEIRVTTKEIICTKPRRRK